MPSRAKAPLKNPARELVDAAQAGVSFDDFAEHVLAVLEQTIGFDTGLTVRADSGRLVTTRHMDSAQIRLAKLCEELAPTRYARDFERPFVVSQEQGGCIDREIYSLDEIRNLTIYREVNEPAGVRSMLHLCARWQGQPILRINMNRHGRQLFRATDLERALSLLPTVEASLVSLQVSATLRATQSLTPRELEIARQVARGLTTPQIAHILGTSKFTVRNQLVSIFDKLKVASRSELAARMAVQSSLFGPPNCD